MLKFSQEFADVIFPDVKKILLVEPPSVWLGQTTNQTRVPVQQIHNWYSDRWIVLKFLQEFPEAISLGVDNRHRQHLVGPDQR
jgi:hypothetical protein